jgi:hypothetical protein
MKHNDFGWLLLFANTMLGSAGATGVEPVSIAALPHARYLAQSSLGDASTPTGPIATPSPRTHKSARHDTRRAPSDDEALALSALEGLMSQPAERALPILKKVLAGSQTDLVKARALFVVSQINKPEAQSLLLDLARDAKHPLRTEAIRNIGIGGNDSTVAALSDLYNTGDEFLRKEVLHAWLVSGKKQLVYQAAISAKTETEAAAAIRTLATMGARGELRRLGEQRKTNPSLLEAYAVSGDLSSLVAIADREGNLELRADAVRKIGIISNDAARKALRHVYASTKSAELRAAALQGMLVANDQQGFLSLYRGAKDANEKRQLLQMLSATGGDAALAAIDAALDSKK